jgi:hypothetical protein
LEVRAVMKMTGMAAVDSVGLEALADLDAVHVGHHDIEQDEVGRLVLTRSSASRPL